MESEASCERSVPPTCFEPATRPYLISKSHRCGSDEVKSCILRSEGVAVMVGHARVGIKRYISSLISEKRRTDVF